MNYIKTTLKLLPYVNQQSTTLHSPPAAFPSTVRCGLRGAAWGGARGAARRGTAWPRHGAALRGCRTAGGTHVRDRVRSLVLIAENERSIMTLKRPDSTHNMSKARVYQPLGIEGHRYQPTTPRGRRHVTIGSATSGVLRRRLSCALQPPREVPSAPRCSGRQQLRCSIFIPPNVGWNSFQLRRVSREAVAAPDGSLTQAPGWPEACREGQAAGGVCPAASRQGWLEGRRRCAVQEPPSCWWCMPSCWWVCPSVYSACELCVCSVPGFSEALEMFYTVARDVH